VLSGGCCSDVSGLGVAEEVDHQLFDLVVFQQEAVVTVERGDGAEEGAGYQCCQQLLFLKGEEHVRCYSHYEGFGAYPPEGFFEAATASGYVVRVHALAELVVAESAEAADQFLTLVALVGGCAFAGVDVAGVGFSEESGGAGLHFEVGVVVPVGEQGHGAGCAHAFDACAFGLFEPCAVGFDGHSLGGIEGDAPGRVLCVGGYREDIFEEFGFFDGPFEQLLAAHAAADADVYLLDTKVFF